MAVLFSVLLASCTSSTGPNLELTSPGFNATNTTTLATTETAAGMPVADDGSAAQGVVAEGDAELPDEVALLPAAKPGTPPPTAETAQAEPAATAVADGTSPLEPAAQAAAVPETASDSQPAQNASAPSGADGATKPTAFATAGEPPAAAPIAPKKKSFLSAFFGTAPAAAAQRKVEQASAAPVSTPPKPEKAKPIIQLASADSDEKPLVMASLGSENALPGVRQTALFEIKRKSGIDDDSDVDLHEDEDGPPVLLASAAGMARLAPNGLLKQTESVDVACLKPSLVRVLKQLEQHYGRKMMVTSGYRSPSHNRRARGAKNSLHMYCAAADVQIAGVSKWELAKYVRAMPGRGGVGTYCHTESVHVDVGPERDWNWRCRRRK